MKLSSFGWLLGALLIAGCHARPAQPDPAPRRFEQWSGQQGGGATNTRVLHTAAEWVTFWEAVGGEMPRPLDASREMAIVVELGEKRTGGYTVEILGVRTQGGQVLVEYRETAPEPGAMLIQVLTSPWAAAIVPKSDLPVVFHRVGSSGAVQER